MYDKKEEMNSIFCLSFKNKYIDMLSKQVPGKQSRNKGKTKGTSFLKKRPCLYCAINLLISSICRPALAFILSSSSFSFVSS